MGGFAVIVSRASGLAAAVAFLASALVPGCARFRDDVHAASVTRPAPLRLGYTPAEDVVGDREGATRALADYLSATLSVPVEVVRTASYGPAIQAMARGEIDVMPLGPFAHVIAARRGVAEAIAVLGRRDSGPRMYRSAIVANRRTGLARLEEVPARARQLRFNYTDPASNSGHLAPLAALAQLGVVAERDFASVEYTRSHGVALFNVAFDQADIAGVSDSVFTRLVEKHRLPRDELVVLWRSEPMPGGPVAIRRALPAELKRGVQDALVRFEENDPARARVAMSAYSEDGVVFLPCDDSLFAGVHALAENVDEGVAQ